MIFPTSAIVLIDNIIDGLLAKYPIGSDEVRLEDSRSENRFILALRMYGFINTVNDGLLL